MVTSQKHFCKILAKNAQISVLFLKLTHKIFDPSGYITKTFTLNLGKNAKISKHDFGKTRNWEWETLQIQIFMEYL